MSNFERLLEQAVKFDFPFKLKYADDLTKEQVRFLKEFSDLFGTKQIKKFRKLIKDLKAHNKSLSLPIKSHTGKKVDIWIATNKIEDDFAGTIKEILNALNWIDPK